MIPLAVAVVLGAVMGAVGRRVAGGLEEGWKYRLPGLLTKWFFGAMLGGAAALGGAPWWLALGVGVGAWLGHILGLHSSGSMGHTGLENRMFSWPLFGAHWAGMSAYGVAVLLVGFWLRLWSADWSYNSGDVYLILAALATPLIYTIAWLIQDHKPGKHPWNSNPMELAEWPTGAVYGIACALIMQ